MAFAQVGVPFYEELNKTAFADPVTLPKCPSASTVHSLNSSDDSSTSSSGYSSGGRGIPSVPIIRGSRPSEPIRGLFLRRLSAQFEPMLTSDSVDLKSLSSLSQSHRSNNSSQQIPGGEDELAGDIIQKTRRRSSLERDETGKIKHVSSVVSPETGSETTAAFSDAALTGDKSICSNCAGSSLRDIEKEAWKRAQTWAGLERKFRRLLQFRLKLDRLCDSYLKREERIVMDFSKIREDMRALHLQERLDLDSKWEEDSQETLNEFIESKQFKSLSDEDFDRTLRELADKKKSERQADLEDLEKRHMADWRRFLHDKKTSLVQLQQALVTALENLDKEEKENLDKEEKRRMSNLQTDLDRGSQGTQN